MSDIDDFLLTEEQLVYYTGYTQPAAQIRFLQKWGIRHVVNAAGRPRVTRDQINGFERPRTGPNFDALDKVG
jgi:hypothetical protein